MILYNLFSFNIYSGEIIYIHPSNWTMINVKEGMEDGTTTTTDQSNLGASSEESQDNSTYQSYSPNDAVILSQKNSGNIEYLKHRIDDIDTTNKQMLQYIFDISNNLTELNQQMDTITEQQATYAQQNIDATAVTSDTANMDLSMPSSVDTASSSTT